MLLNNEVILSITVKGLMQAMPCLSDKHLEIPDRPRIGGYHVDAFTGLHSVKMLLKFEQRHRASQPTRIQLNINCYHAIALCNTLLGDNVTNNLR